MMFILSLGAGVQSTTLLLLSAQGLIPKYDAAIFSDTGWEPKAVYEHFEKLKKVAEDAGIPVYIVSDGNIKDDHIENNMLSMPLYSKRSGEKTRMITRQCTSRYKLRPIQRFIRKLLGGQPTPTGRIGQPPSGAIATVDIGISLDELHRAKDSKVKYVKHTFTLLDMRWSRDDCIKFLEENGFAETPKSACVVCPFRGNPAWLEIKTTRPEEWLEAVGWERKLREKNPNYYVHGQAVPLDEVDLTKKRGRPRKLSCSPFSCIAEQLEFESP